jgi:hypothetical protein
MKICSVCNQAKESSTYYKWSSICQPCKNTKTREYRNLNENKCTKKYEKTKKGFLVRMYRNMTSRVLGIQKRSINLYLGKSILSKDEFYNWALNDTNFNLLFDEWEKNEYKRKITPSIDRIDSKFGYTLDNIQFLTLSENSSKTSKNKKYNGQITTQF